MPEPLTEKYRPRTLDDVTGNREVLECLKTFQLADLPNLLFYGPPGTGKTTTARALLKDLPRMNVMELNASDSRGIDTVREQIKEFAQAKTDTVKVVVLDEADSMSRDAQNALRRIMEDYENTRFCLICNYSKKIIEPIASRCTRFRFCPVNEADRIREICVREGIKHTEDGIALLNEHSDGDMRKVMNDLQGMRGSYAVVSRESILEFFGIRDDHVYQEIFAALQSASAKECRERIAREDVDCAGLIGRIADMLVQSATKNKMKILRELASIEKRLAAGCSEGIQTNALVGAFILNR